MVLCFAILQLLCLLIWGYTPYPDSNDYLPLARQSVLEHGIYPTASQMHELPFIWNLGAINTLVGSLYAFHSVYPVHILYILMKSISAWLVFQIAKHLTNDTIAFIALCVYVLYPANYGEANSFLSEVPFTFFTLLSVYKLSMITLVKEFPQYTVLQWLVVYNLMYYYAFLLLAAIGAYLLLRKREVFNFILLFGMVLLYTLFIIIIAGKGESRFHIPLMPYFIILASIAIFGLKIRRGKRT